MIGIVLRLIFFCKHFFDWQIDLNTKARCFCDSFYTRPLRLIFFRAIRRQEAGLTFLLLLH
jgi:hypothetical protein